MSRNLELAAQKVVDAWEGKDLASAVRELDAQLKKIKNSRIKHKPDIETARIVYVTDDLEIDDEPILTVSEDGVWVGSWVWVNTPDAEN